jgi:Spy/CpxP family protein refolding chaperone
MKRHIATVLSILMVSALATSVLAEPGGRHQGRDFGMHGGDFRFSDRMIERMANHLDLDEAQQQSMQAILDASKSEIDALRTRRKANREAMQALDSNAPDYSALINNIALENGQLATEGTLLFSRIRNDINAVLTDEQREKLATRRENMRKRRGERWHQRRDDSNES